jgi:hypothetical protein
MESFMRKSTDEMSWGYGGIDFVPLSNHLGGRALRNMASKISCGKAA